MTTITYHALILGYIWQPGAGMCSLSTTWTPALFVDGSPYTDEHAVLDAQTTQAGDFQQVLDVRVGAEDACGTCWPCVHRPEQHFCYQPVARLVKEWHSEEHECAYLDTIREWEED